jgi:hypothetical protein
MQPFAPQLWATVGLVVPDPAKLTRVEGPLGSSAVRNLRRQRAWLSAADLVSP